MGLRLLWRRPSLAVGFGLRCGQAVLPARRPQPEHNVGVALDIARFLAPIVAGWAALIAVVSVFRDRVQQLLIPFKHGHVVVCGLGYAGFEFVRKLRAAGYRAVVIESDENNPRIRTCRNWGSRSSSGMRN